MIGAPLTKLRQVRGNRIAMVFQEPMTSLNPLHTSRRRSRSVADAPGHGRRGRARHRSNLHVVGMGDPARLASYPHQLSGGSASAS